VEGVKFTRLAFNSDGSAEVTYTPPKDWNYSGTPTKLTLHPPGKAPAEGTIATLKLPAPQSLDDETTARLTQETLASVPQGSTTVVLVSQEKSPVTIGEKETYQVVVSYEFFGQKFQKSVLFLNRSATEQVRFQLVSRAADFPDLQRLFMTSLFSIQHL
jgi:hypothetical protein